MPIDWAMLNQYEQNGFLSRGAGDNIRAFIGLNERDQRDWLSNKQKTEELLYNLFAIVEKIKGAKDLLTYTLCLINGIIEDRRIRIKYLVGIQKSKNDEKQKDLIGILNSFII